MILTKQEATKLREKYEKLGFKLVKRMDAYARGLIEAICEHGVGHPIPESEAHMKRITKQDTWGIHGCDGCCAAFGAVRDWGTEVKSVADALAIQESERTGKTITLESDKQPLPPQLDVLPDGSKP
jgi:hypothetical protein